MQTGFSTHRRVHPNPLGIQMNDNEAKVMMITDCQTKIFSN